MQKKIIWLLLSSLMVLSLVLVSCGEAEEEEEEEVVIPPAEEEEVVVPPEEEEEIVVPSGVNWWDKFGEPEYGGALILREALDPSGFDPYRGRNTLQQMYLESLAHGDWALDRNIWSYQAVWVPTERYVPCLAESWEQPDMETVIVHVRQGVHWHDKPPMNGREMDAYDIEWSWHRQSGLGSGFEPSPFVWAGNYKYLESITATDKWTIVFKGTEPSTQILWSVVEIYNNCIVPREVVEIYGDMQDWENVCGTAPFMLDDYVADTSYTFTKNPNYWGWDERHPENKVPYVDAVKILIIPDNSTAYSALRTGKIDKIDGVPWEQAHQLMKTNPELNYQKILGAAPGILGVITNEPFNDIRVRKALNMALDRPTIAESYYGGLVEGKAYPWLGPLLGDLYTPFEEWPEDIKEGYIYNPEGAKALLAEAGYPDGFKTNCMISSATDTDLYQVVMHYFSEIGVEIETKTIDAPAFFSYVMVNRGADQMYWGGGGATSSDPGPMMDMFTKGHFVNAAELWDEHIMDLLHRASTSLDIEETYRLWKEADLYVVSQYWLIGLPPTVNYIIWQPWLKGYSAESMTRFLSQRYARMWIDYDIKKSMGYE